MAIVFRARDERLGRPVALKILAPALAGDAEFQRRFIRESREAAAIDDPRIVPVFAAGEADGLLFIAMRYVAGGDAHSLLKREGPLPPARVAAIVSPMAMALDAAHRAGSVHRDVKPSNMLIDVLPGRPDHVYLYASCGQFAAALRDAFGLQPYHSAQPAAGDDARTQGYPVRSSDRTPVTPVATLVAPPTVSPPPRGPAAESGTGPLAAAGCRPRRAAAAVGYRRSRDAMPAAYASLSHTRPDLFPAVHRPRPAWREYLRLPVEWSRQLPDGFPELQHLGKFLRLERGLCMPAAR